MNLVSIYLPLCNIKLHCVFNTIFYINLGTENCDYKALECSISVKFLKVNVGRKVFTSHILAVLVTGHVILWIIKQSLFRVFEPN